MARTERQPKRGEDQPPPVIEADADAEAEAEVETVKDEDNKNFITNDRVGVSFGVKLNTGNYTSADITLWHAADVPPDMSPSETREALMRQLQHEVKQFARPIIAKKERKQT